MSNVLNLRTTLVCILLLAMTACGFQPRGSGEATFAAALQPVLIQGMPDYHDFSRTLKRQLDEQGVATATDAAAAKAIIQVAPPRGDRQLLSVDSRNKTVEYIIRETLRFSLRSGEALLIADQQLAAERILFNPGTRLLGRTEEERLLRQDMYEELARRLLRRAAAVSP
jgi:outer membrane lipopolysaccharide assembly protein LptE/RlpB